MLKLFDRVKLITNKYTSEGASSGDIGTIVEIHHKPNLPVGYDIEFFNPRTGKPDALVIVLEKEIEKVD
jgi:hypothetical protein